jgi:hypothetical protein
MKRKQEEKCAKRSKKKGEALSRSKNIILY